MSPETAVRCSCEDHPHQAAAGVLTVGLCGFLNTTLNLVWTSPGITGVKVMGTLMELKGPISPSVTCVRRGVLWGQDVGIMVLYQGVSY